MSIPNTQPLERPPVHPGGILREDFLPDYGLTVAALARALGVSRQSVNELLRERRAVSPEMALRLAKVFGTSPEFWLNLQRAVDLWDAARGTGPHPSHPGGLRGDGVGLIGHVGRHFEVITST